MILEEEETCPADMFILYGLLSARYITLYGYLLLKSTRVSGDVGRSQEFQNKVFKYADQLIHQYVLL